MRISSIWIFVRTSQVFNWEIVFERQMEPSILKKIVTKLSKKKIKVVLVRFVIYSGNTKVIGFRKIVFNFIY